LWKGGEWVNEGKNKKKKKRLSVTKTDEADKSAEVEEKNKVEKIFQ
jgi:hypothetical protein